MWILPSNWDLHSVCPATKHSLFLRVSPSLNEKSPSIPKPRKITPKSNLLKLYDSTRRAPAFLVHCSNSSRVKGRSERKFVGEIFLDLYDLSDMCDEQHLHTKVADIFAKDDVYDPLGIKEREHKAKALAAMVGAWLMSWVLNDSVLSAVLC